MALATGTIPGEFVFFFDWLHFVHLNSNLLPPILRYIHRVQSLQLDHRYDNGKCFFLSTSQGNVMHVDLRSKGKVTFNQEFSPRKINSVR